jgi:hypothetical protein
MISEAIGICKLGVRLHQTDQLGPSALFLLRVSKCGS